MRPGDQLCGGDQQRIAGRAKHQKRNGRLIDTRAMEPGEVMENGVRVSLIAGAVR
jgi:hypothetical protein